VVLVRWGGDGSRATAIIVHGSLEMTKRQDQCLCGMFGVCVWWVSAPTKQGDEVGETRPNQRRAFEQERERGAPLHKRNPDAVLRKMCLVNGGEEEEEGECG